MEGYGSRHCIVRKRWHCLGAWLRSPAHRITDQGLLREAVEEWRLAGGIGDGPDEQILSNKAAQGYYGPELALKWARSRADLGQRTLALIGIAEALGHARPPR